MPQFYDSDGNEIRLGSKLGRGGEGSVFAISERADVVAKIYHEPISPEKAEKLRQMVALKTDKLLRLAAWVTDVLLDSPQGGGKVVGFLMPRLSFGTQIHELYNPQSRRRRFPDADWRFLIRAAANTARSFAVVHAHNHAIGDVNHGNIVIARDATVRLIDCDSYHLNAPEQKFLCEVGVSTHTPPELQGKTLRDIERTANHDAFGLAVLIFQMLFMGRHPFSGKFLSAVEQTLEQSIAERRFAYGDDAKNRLIKQPPGTLSLAAVSPEIAALFRRAFLEIENRPSAREWADALENLEENLRECNLNAAHFFYNNLEKCPWCALEVETGVLFFPARFGESFNADGGAAVDVLTVGRLIDAIKPPEAPSALPAKPTNSLLQIAANPQFSLRVSASLAKFNQRLTLYLLGLSATIILMIVSLGFGSFIGIALGFFWICYVIVESLTRDARNEAQRALDEANHKWTVFQNDWNKLASSNSFTAKRADLRKALADYRNLARQRDEKLKTLDADGRARQLDFYLKGFSINKSGVRGLDDAKLRELRAAGICGADNVTDQMFDRLPFFNQLHKKKLLEWRQNLEKNFVFKSSARHQKQEIERIDAELAVERGRLEAEIRNGLPLLQKLSLQVTHDFQNLSQQTEKIAAELQIAEKDYEKVVDLKGTAVAWTVGVVFLSLIVGIPIRNMINVKPDYSLNGYPGSAATLARGEAATKGGGYGIASGTTIVHDKKSPDGLVVSPEDWGEAGEFYRTGVKQFSEGKYKKAAAAFERAKKLKPDVSELHIRLGESLYLDGKYQKAVAAYNDGLRINPKNSDAFHKLGSAYNKLLRRTEAIKAFKDAIEANPNAIYSLYELGAVLREDERADEAIEYLETALSKQPNLNEARYELALSYAAMGYRQLAWTEHGKLKDRDSDLAKKLYWQLTDNHQSPPMYVVREPEK